MPRFTMDQQGNFTQFYESPVRVYDYKQISEWIDRADGPSLGGFNNSSNLGLHHELLIHSYKPISKSNGVAGISL